MSLLSRTVVIVGMFALTGLVDLALGARSFGADMPLVSGHPAIQSLPASRRAPKVDAETRLEEFAKGPNATCTAWTDGCRSCGNGPEGVFCSNVGIACQPSEPRCSRR
jgi:hypothetical protein